MKLRSLLFVPGDRPDRMPKGRASGADALILDLEDSVASTAKPTARRETAAFLADTDRQVPLFVRINPLQSGLAEADLEAVLPARPSGIMLPKTEGAASVRALEAMLEEHGNHDAGVLAIAAETPLGVLRLGELADCRGRLAGLTWGAEDLPAAIGAQAARHEDGSYTPPYEVARSMMLFAAAAAGVAAIETVFPAFRDVEGVGLYAQRGARDGFTGMMCLHPAQVEPVNRAFTPSAAAVAEARAIVDAFSANPGIGVLTLDGQMIDMPHLRRAQALLARAG